MAVTVSRDGRRMRRRGQLYTPTFNSFIVELGAYNKAQKLSLSRGGRMYVCSTFLHSLIIDLTAEPEQIQ